MSAARAIIAGWSLPLPWPVPWGGNALRRRRVARPGVPPPDAVTDARFGGGDDDPAEWVTVYWASGFEEAHIVRGALLTVDIPVLLKSEAAVLGTAGVVGVRVQVPRPLEGRARETLEPE